MEPQLTLALTIYQARIDQIHISPLAPALGVLVWRELASVSRTWRPAHKGLLGHRSGEENRLQFSILRSSLCSDPFSTPRTHPQPCPTQRVASLAAITCRRHVSISVIHDFAKIITWLSQIRLCWSQPFLVYQGRSLQLKWTSVRSQRVKSRGGVLKVIIRWVLLGAEVESKAYSWCS